jgi:hypothetical protein
VVGIPGLFILSLLPVALSALVFLAGQLFFSINQLNRLIRGFNQGLLVTTGKMPFPLCLLFRQVELHGGLVLSGEPALEAGSSFLGGENRRGITATRSLTVGVC